MRLVVTGGSGFIGTNLIHTALLKDITCLNLDIAPPRDQSLASCYKQIDIMDSDTLGAAIREFQPTHVVHLAARTDLDEKSDLSAYRVNFQGTQTVLETVSTLGTGVRVIVASTVFIWPTHGVHGPSDSPAPDTTYGASKAEMERVVRCTDLPVEWVLVRPSMVWGPWHDRLRREFFAVLRRGLYIHPGQTDCRKSYSFVGNLVHQLLGLLQADSAAVVGRTFTISDPPVDLLEWVNAFSRQLRGRDVPVLPARAFVPLGIVGDMLAAVGVRSPLTSFRLRNMTRSNVVDVDDTFALLGPSPISLAAGVLATASWLRGETVAYPFTAGAETE